MTLLLKFEFNNIKYFVEKDSDEKLIYYFIKDKNKYFDLSTKQKELIDNVIEKITPSNNLIKLTSYKLNDINYEMYLDKKTKLRLFKPIPKVNDSIYLNNVFNNMEEGIASKGPIDRLQPRNESPFIKRLINIGTEVIVVCISIALITFNTAIMMSPSLAYNIEDIVFNKSYSSIEETSKLSDEELLSRITDVINNNKNLSNEEKKLFLANPFVFTDNKQYMNLYYIENILSTISIEYISENHFNTAGVYNPIKNIISFYHASCLEEVDDYTFYHEILHALTQHFFVDNNSFLIETTNTIFNDEYINYERSFYKNYFNYTKALMQIIGSEPLKKYHNYSRLDYIINPLCEIINDKEKAEKLVYNLDNYKKIYDEITDNEIDTDERYANLKKLESYLYSEFNDYFYKKNGANIEDDLIMLYYLDEEAFKQKIIDEFKLNGSIDDYYVTTVESIFYFNSEKKKNPHLTISVSSKEDNKLIYSFVINDENRYLNKNNAKHI